MSRIVQLCPWRDVVLALHANGAISVLEVEGERAPSGYLTSRIAAVRARQVREGDA